MKKEAVELLKNHLDSREKTIISIFEVINREIISNIYLVENEVLEGIIYYFKDRSGVNLDRIWGEKSIQKNVFLYCINIWEIYEKTKSLRKEDIEELVKEEFLKKIFLELYPEILKLCEDSEEFSDKDLYMYRNDNIKISVVNMSEYEKIKGCFSSDEVYFRIVFEGIVKVEKAIIFQGEGYFSKKKPILEKVSSITKDCFQIIIAVKNKILTAIGIDFYGIENKKIKIGNLKLFDFLIKKKNIEENNYFKVYQLLAYLSQIVKNDEIDFFDIPYLKYKRKILQEVENNYLEDERYIVERLTQTLDLSIPTLYKIFNILFSESPTRFIERKKMNYASGLLVNSNESIENISSQLGYSRRTFSRKFLNFSGYMPTKFRELMMVK